MNKWVNIIVRKWAGWWVNIPLNTNTIPELIFQATTRVIKSVLYNLLYTLFIIHLRILYLYDIPNKRINDKKIIFQVTNKSCYTVVKRINYISFDFVDILPEVHFLP